jgi:hypothetical protein
MLLGSVALLSEFCAKGMLCSKEDCATEVGPLLAHARLFDLAGFPLMANVGRLLFQSSSGSNGSVCRHSIHWHALVRDHCCPIHSGVVNSPNAGFRVLEIGI